MNTFCITLYILFSIIAPLKAHNSENYLGQDLDLKRYEDLWQDPDSKRFLKIILDLTYDHARYRTLEERADLKWARKEKEIIRPILLEVLRRETNDNKNTNELHWVGIDRKGYAIEWALINKVGDLKPFVEEVRKQLPIWINLKEESGMNSGFIREALKLIALKGDSSDIPLIEGFLEDPNGNNRHYAEKNLAALKERLASELSQNRKDRDVRGERDNTISATANSKDINPSSLQSDSVEGQKSPILWYILSALGVVLLFTFFKLFKGNSAS